MANNPKFQPRETPGAPANSTNKGSTLTPEERAEFMASLEEEEILAAAMNCADLDPAYND